MKNANTQRWEPVLAWFTGKARDNAEAALILLDASEELGEWLPKAARFVRAALDKSNVAKKLGKAYKVELCLIGNYQNPGRERGQEVASMLQFGYSRKEIDFAKIREAAPEAMKPVIDQAKAFSDTMTPLFELMTRLDKTRPKPVFTKLGASPTVTKTLTDLGLANTVAETVRPCPVEWTTVDVLVNGKMVTMPVGTLIWPEGTKHNAGNRFNGGTLGHQCQACGHAILNSLNWIPLLIDNAQGVPHSLWVGRDCARTIFGIKVTGVMELQNRGGHM